MANDPKKQESWNFICKNSVNLMGMHICVLLLVASGILFFPTANTINLWLWPFPKKNFSDYFGWCLWQALGINDMIKGILANIFWK